jgi:hypothetical protein
MNRCSQPYTDRSATMERALALLLMIDDKDASDGPIIAELASQLHRQLAQGDVGSECERAFVALALQKAYPARPLA